MSLWGGRYSHAELRKVCELLAKEQSVGIALDEKSNNAACYDVKSKTIEIGTSEIWLHGVDYYVGLILHEIGHVRHTKVPDMERKLLPVYNMLEDERVEEVIMAEYDGGEYYLNEHHRKVWPRIERYLDTPARYPTCASVVSVAGEFAGEYRAELLMRTIASALLLAHGKAPRIKTRCVQTDELAGAIADILRKARTVSGEDIAGLVREVVKLIEDSGLSLPEQRQGEGEGEGEDMRRALEQKGRSVEARGFGYSASGEKTDAERYIRADELAEADVPLLKRRLLRQLRENERTRYEGDKRRGLLDKKTLARVARDSFRVYRKRVLPKGKRYAAMVVLDTSGSMWINSRIDRGMYSACMMIRALRGLGYPAGLVLYGAEASVVLDPLDTYVRAKVAAEIESLTGRVYNSGDNETHEGIKAALPRLISAGIGRSKLLVIITDGGLYGRDVKESPVLIEQARKKYGVHTMIYYVETSISDTVRLLNDPEREIEVLEARDLPAAVSALIRKVAYSELDVI